MRSARRLALPHVVVVTPELWGVTRENGGISTSVFHFARLFSERGHRVTLLVGIAKQASVSAKWAQRYDAAEIEVRTAVPTRSSRGIDGAPYSIDFPFRRISEAVADALPDDTDIVYFQDWCALGFETLRRRLLGRARRHPTTVTVLRGSSQWARQGSELLPDPDGSRTALDRAERFAVEHSDFVVSPSQSYRDEVGARGVRLSHDERTRVLQHPWLPLGDPHEKVLLPNGAFRRLVYFGRLETRKGLDLFLDALTTLARSSDCLQGIDEVVFLGRDGVHRRESLERVAQEASSCGLESVFLTELDTWAASSFLSEVAPDGLVVLPSLRENFPNAVIEASLVPGLNALYSKVGGVPEILGEGARRQLFAPDVGALVGVLEEWLRGGPLSSAELAAYDWETANARWLGFHDEVLGGRGAPSRRPGLLRPAVVRRNARAGGGQSLGVVISVYEFPEALDASLRALFEQSDQLFEVVVADDGSGPEVKAVVDEWRPAFGDRLAYVWQPDEGFRLARVLDVGALASRAEYFVFVHDDSIPRRGFVRAIRSSVRPGWFVAGRRVEISQTLTRRVLDRRLPVHRWSLARWLRERDDVASLSALTPRDRRRVGAHGILEFEPVNRAYGYLTGVSRVDFERVNGYDTRFVGWGEEDVDLAVRLRRLGLKCGHAGPQATLLHLWHPVREIEERPNWWLLQETEQSDRVEAIVGLRELGDELAGAQVSANRVGASSSSSEPAKL